MLTSGDEHVVLETRQHGVVLIRAFAQSFFLVACGAGLFALGWPWTSAAAGLFVVAALLALIAVWRWERTRIVVTTRKLFVVRGTLRRRASAVRLGRIGTMELEQTLLGRFLGYGTLLAGELEIEYVPAPRELYAVVERVVA
jgi:uncharacterized membrane protein YdbT with pleckstrin-like domain